MVIRHLRSVDRNLSQFLTTEAFRRRHQRFQKLIPLWESLDVLNQARQQVIDIIRDIARARTGIGGQFLLVKRLCHVKGLFGSITIATIRIFLKGSQVIE